MACVSTLSKGKSHLAVGHCDFLKVVNFNIKLRESDMKQLCVFLLYRKWEYPTTKTHIVSQFVLILKK